MEISGNRIETVGQLKDTLGRMHLELSELTVERTLRDLSEAEEQQAKKLSTSIWWLNEHLLEIQKLGFDQEGLNQCDMLSASRLFKYDAPERLTCPEVCVALGWSQSKLNSRIRKNTIPSHKDLDGARWFSKTELEAWYVEEMNKTKSCGLRLVHRVAV